MAAISFPASPATDQVFSSGASVWQWDGTAWRVIRNTDVPTQLAFGAINFNGATLTEALFTEGTLNTSHVLSGVALNDGYTEEVFPIVDAANVAITPRNGSIQTWTLGASRSPVSGAWVSGQSMTLMVTAGANAITWDNVPVTWIGGIAPTLATTGITVIQLWKIGSTVYGVLTGNT